MKCDTVHRRVKVKGYEILIKGGSQRIAPDKKRAFVRSRFVAEVYQGVGRAYSSSPKADIAAALRSAYEWIYQREGVPGSKRPPKPSKAVATS